MLIFPKESKDAKIAPLQPQWLVCSVLPRVGLGAQEQEGFPYSKQSECAKLLPTNPSGLAHTMGALFRVSFLIGAS